MKKKFLISFIIAILMFVCISTQVHAEEIYNINSKEHFIRFAEEVNNSGAIAAFNMGDIIISI